MKAPPFNLVSSRVSKKSVGDDDKLKPKKKITAKKTTTKRSRKVVSRLRDGDKVTKPRNKYFIGMHGAKTREQKRLAELYGEKVTGKKGEATHESEHPIGFEPINQTNENKRGKSDRAKRLENCAPAYQEEYDRHRAHIGTGNHNRPDDSGFNSESYRNSQRQLLLDDEPGVAVQLNQLAYAFDEDFELTGMESQKQSNDSFQEMGKNVKSFKFANDYTDKNSNQRIERDEVATFKPDDYQEMLASRATALLKRYLIQPERMLLNYVVQGELDYNDFLAACKYGKFDGVLEKLDLLEYNKEFYELYKELIVTGMYDRQEKKPSFDNNN